MYANLRIGVSRVIFEFRGLRAGLMRNDIDLRSANDGLLAKSGCGLFL